MASFFNFAQRRGVSVAVESILRGLGEGCAQRRRTNETAKMLLGPASHMCHPANQRQGQKKVTSFRVKIWAGQDLIFVMYSIDILSALPKIHEGFVVQMSE